MTIYDIAGGNNDYTSIDDAINGLPLSLTQNIVFNIYADQINITAIVPNNFTSNGYSLTFQSNDNTKRKLWTNGVWLFQANDGKTYYNLNMNFYNLDVMGTFGSYGFNDQGSGDATFRVWNADKCVLRSGQAYGPVATTKSCMINITNSISYGSITCVGAGGLYL